MSPDEKCEDNDCYVSSTSDTLAVTLWSAQEIGGLSKLGVELFIFGYGHFCGKCQEIKLFCYFILAAENIAFIIFAET